MSKSNQSILVTALGVLAMHYGYRKRWSAWLGSPLGEFQMNARFPLGSADLL